MDETDKDAGLNVFDVEFFGIKDGPGIRTVIFLKGCPLHCSWCQNPESQESEPSILYFENSCVQCGLCRAKCPHGAIQARGTYGLVTDHALCRRCGACVDACLYNARKVSGRRYGYEELQDLIRKDVAFFQASGGGITFSGGEPAMQLDSLEPLVRWARDEGITVAIETAGNVPQAAIERIAGLFDLIFIDLKHVDSDLHRQFTGAGNERILESIGWLLAHCPEKTIVRIPVIPDFNFSPEAGYEMLDFIRGRSERVITVELLPYHDLGKYKYSALGMEYGMGERKSLEKRELEPWRAYGNQLGLQVTIGAI